MPIRFCSAVPQPPSSFWIGNAFFFLPQRLAKTKAILPRVLLLHFVPFRNLCPWHLPDVDQPIRLIIGFINVCWLCCTLRVSAAPIISVLPLSFPSLLPFPPFPSFLLPPSFPLVCVCLGWVRMYVTWVSLRRTLPYMAGAHLAHGWPPAPFFPPPHLVASASPFPHRP
eukprot:TRINITY_DN1200_c0_g1_i1.p1 TRINITY_DN1200_c0_g1~~TRINITY_DN1200_c0_g1_i1.p1  ORF type:complete len:169 (+),score=2.55 TRINITY_DN1200_c0_g1_i1:608-1114(+)